MAAMRDPRSSAAVGLLAAGLLAVASCAAAFASSAAPEVPGGYLRIVAVAPGYATGATAQDRWLVYLDGFMDTGAAGRFVRLLERRKVATATVYLNSPGGHLVEAMRFGREIRARGFDTVVGARSADAVTPRPGLCFSACPFALAGGVRRSLEPGSLLGVHRAANRVPVADEADFQSAVASQAREYLTEMGVSVDLVALMEGAPHDSIRDITPAEAAELHLVTPQVPADR
jgi:hypothetical protein